MADNAHPQYAVKHQHKRSKPDGQGGFHNVWTVHYETPSGTESHVEVPEKFYHPHNVHNMIQDELDRIEGVNSLGTGPAPPPPQPPIGG